MECSVSVVIPTYNRKKQLYDAIQSAIEQTFKNKIEIIIVDDSAKSIRSEIRKNFKLEKNREIVYIHNRNKKGAPYARNLGIDAANGEYVAFLDDDDMWTPTKIEEQVKILKERECALIICWMLDKRFNKTRINKLPEKIELKEVLNALNLSSTSTYIVSKKQLIFIGKFDEQLASAQEYDLAIRFAKCSAICCVQRVLTIQNATEGQISENWSRKIRGLLAVYKKHRVYFNKASKLNSIKVMGMIIIFFAGIFIGNSIYSIITIAKERHEL